MVIIDRRSGVACDSQCCATRANSRSLYRSRRFNYMAYLYGTTTELVYRKDIIHMTFSRFDLFERGWTERQIKEYLGQPDYRVRRGHRNTGPILYWKKARVNEIEARLNHVTIPALGYNQDAGDDKEE